MQTDFEFKLWLTLVFLNNYLIGGRLRNINTGEGFLFEVKKGNKYYNDRHYEALGEVSATHTHTCVTDMYMIHVPYLGPQDAWSSGPQLRRMYQICKQLPFQPIHSTY